MTVETTETFPITPRELPTFEAHQEHDKSKAELGLTEEQVETLKQVSSLVGMFQQEALNEKQTRLLAQLKALEKDRLATDAWKIIAALKKEKGDLETQVERLKAQNSKLNTESFLSRRHSSRLSGNTREVLIESNNRFKDELSKLFCKISTVRTTQGHRGDKEMKEQQRELNDVVDTVPLSTSSNKETSKTVDTRNQDIIHQENDSAQDSPVTPPREFRDPVVGVCGLENLGNTCFVNAGLQCLFSVAPFCRFFLGGGHNTVTHKSHKENQVSLSKHLADLVKKVWSGCYLQCDPSELYKAITAHFPTQLNRQRQHDCHEFLALFLDGLHRELNCSTLPSLFPDQSDNNVSAEEKWRQYTMSNESLIVDTFQGQLQSKVTCSNCNHESVKYQPFTFLSVPILSESYHTFVVTWVYSYTPNTSQGNTLSAVRYKVQVTKPSTVLKLKSNFLSLLTAEKETPQLKDIVVCVVRNSQIISIMEDGQQLTPFTDRRSKLYIVKPCQVPESPLVQEDEKSTSLSCLAGRDSTLFYSPDVANTPEFMSALDELQSVSSPVSKNHLTRLVNPDTSTPKTPGQRTRASISNVYHLSGTCCICLEEKISDNELISHDKCGSLFCRQCLQDAAGGAVENHLCCPRCAKQAAVTLPRRELEPDKPARMVLVPVVLRRFEEDSKTKRLFGHPNLIIVSKNIHGKDLYAFIEKMLPEPIREEQDSASLPAFTLHLVEQQGRHCSRCTRITGCGGCQVNKEAILSLQSCDNLAVQLTTIGRWEAERMSRCTEHESIWKPRKREDPLKLGHCLKRFVESEKLPDTWFCQKCHEERNAFKALSICRLPDTLVIHLKRYSQNGVKITTPVEFPLEGLDVCEYTQLEDCPPEQFLYDLIGCVCHRGSYSSGHYTSYTNTNKVWYRYDDCHVTKEMPSINCYSEAYILFYQRRSLLTPSATASTSPRNSEENDLPLLEETQHNADEGDLLKNLQQSATNANATMEEIKEEPAQEFTNVQSSNQQNCTKLPSNGGLLMERIRRKRLKEIQKKKPKQMKATHQEKDYQTSVVYSSEENEDKTVSKCYCKQCEYLTILEKQIKKAKLCTSEVTPLETAEKGNIDSRKSSLTSVLHSVSSSVSPSAANSCSNTSSSEEATQVNKQQRDDSQQSNSAGENKLEAEKLSERLQCAVENENIRRAVMLLRRGADPNILVNGLSALHVAVGLESPLNIRFTRLLLDYGGNPDIASAEGLTPIHVAAMWNRVNCLKLLIDRGGNPYQKDKDGLNALTLAREFEHDTSADTSDFLAKLDDRITKQLTEGSLSSLSLNSNAASDSISSRESPHQGCNLPVTKKVSMRTFTRKILRNLRRASECFCCGFRRIRRLFRSS